MLKVYGIDTDDFSHARSAGEIIEACQGLPYAEVDSETYGFDPHTVDMMCFQIGGPEHQFVIHPDKLWEFQPFLESYPLIGHNLKFDLKFLYKKGIYPRMVWDTMLTEQVIHCGLPNVRHNLAAVAKRRIGVELDKSVRDNIWKEGLTKRVIEYAGDDVKYLNKIREQQLPDLDKWELHQALEIENQFVLSLAYVEFCGFKLDREKWLQKMARDQQALIAAEKAVNDYILQSGLQKFINPQIDMFSEQCSANVNWGSPKQVISLFKTLGIPTEVIEKGEAKESVSKKYIKKVSKDFPIIPLYLKFREYQKLVSTYGETFINQINKNTGRIHTNFRQIMDTSRLSCGGKNKNTGEEYVNLQNLPKDKLTRACFVAEPGNTLAISDYSGQEQIVLANFSMDKNLLEFYDKGLADMHSFVASKMPAWAEELKGLTLEEIKDKHSDKRDKAKNAGFAINYGGNGVTISENLGIPIEEGEAVYEGYFGAFPALKDYFDTQKQKGLALGYVQFNDVTKRKTFIYGYETYLELRKELTRKFWDRWKRVKPLPETNPERIRMREKIKTFFKIKGAIERKTLNFPIQGTSAEITKIACIYFYRWILAEDLQVMPGGNPKGEVRIVNLVHDEIVAEWDEKLSDKATFELQHSMVRAGQIYCKRVPLLAEPELSPYWKK